jgi:hypothetical protein
MKKGPLTKEEIEIIKTSDKSIEELANDLDRSLTSVAKHYVVKTKSKPETIARKAMARHKRNGKYVAVVMTQAAGEIADEVKKQFKRTLNSDCIHKPYGDE